MAQVFSYGELGTFEAAFDTLSAWTLFPGVGAFEPAENQDSAVLYFEGDPQTWIIIQAVPMSEGAKSFVYRTISIDPVPRPFIPAIQIDVWYIPTFQDVLGELEEWFINSDMVGSSEQRSQIWADVVKGLSVLA
jgi:hypothetical protein